MPELPAESFLRIIHDPPIFSLAGELYSGAFYAQLFRVLRRGGRLFHYIGNLNSKGSGGVARGVIRRLQRSGFRARRAPARSIRRGGVQGTLTLRKRRSRRQCATLTHVKHLGIPGVLLRLRQQPARDGVNGGLRAVARPEFLEEEREDCS